VKDRLTINNQVVRDQKIRDLNEVRVFFKGEPRADVAGSRSTVVQPIYVNPSQSQQQPSHAEPARQGDTEIRVSPRGENESEIRVKPGSSTDSRVTVEPAHEGSKVTIEQK
jgi:hypothetical protein